ncbi:hypothetical protein VHEMI03942 [[Torrubiella] hemipterigena]|uniref:Zn(2)-C6 fungal-type domain-containing protein n=1 Tax=[Torrubiella] hemipterigena TaxID=1531966 RepID=A0A0A1SZW6_9HYPO|nr:hypothetical protein VHEMI03942 [[Torrubiella] hemipterigena]
MASAVDAGQTTNEAQRSPKAKMPVKSACDVCHNSKVKCSGGNPCAVCAKANLECKYTPAKGMGRPRGVKNKKTRQRLQEAAESRQDRISSTASESSSYSQASTAQEHIQGMAFGFNPHGPLEHESLGLPTTTSNDISYLYSQHPDTSSSDYLVLSGSMLDANVPLPMGQTMYQATEEFNFSSTSYLTQQMTNRLPNTEQPCGCTPLLATELVRLQSHPGANEKFSFVVSVIEGSISTWQRHLACNICLEASDEYRFTLLALQFRLALERLETFCDANTTETSQGSDRDARLHGSGDSIRSIRRSSPSGVNQDRDDRVTDFVTHKLSTLAEVIRQARCRVGTLKRSNSLNCIIPVGSPESFMDHESMDMQLQDLLGRIYKVQLCLMLTKT